MEIRFNFRRDCYLIDLRRALLFSLIFIGVGMLTCFLSGGMHVYTFLMLPAFAPRLGLCVIIWTVMHIIVALALEILLSSCKLRCNSKMKALVLICTALVVGYMWMPLFLGMNAFLLSLAVCIVCALIVFCALKTLIRLCPFSALLVGIYFVYIVACATLTFCVMILN